ncbi:MAG: aminotransferase class I/II-fold pyridoxal phosphate-dependent enzyme [Thaumarchaeota archaeon]|nr:aminotransferase class I/II-fold pyridoxal phosphate-dependent enzyme [Nitrososphaerota archaeon]
MDGDSTRSVHEAEPIDEKTGSVTVPIYQSSTFGFKKASEVVRAVRGQGKSYVYSRWSNPTVAILEAKLASFEDAEDSAFFASGMAAISTAFLAFVEEGSHVLAIRDLYGESYRLIHEFLPLFGVKSTLVETESLTQMKKGLRKNTKVVYVESPTNPTLKLVDIRRAAKLAHSVNAMLLVDNTFASPINQKPLQLGADITLHSATKYLNGHADVIAGVAAGSAKAIGRVKHVRRILGGTLDPHAAWLILRGMKTMSLRVRAQNQSAQRLAEFLSKNKRVMRVNYPGLRTHPQHGLAGRQMKGFGGMLSFEINGTKRQAMRLTESLRTATLAGSLGGVETLVAQPATLSHAQMSPEDRLRTGISDSLIRVSVGIEDVEDLIRDFEQGLSKI